MKFVPPRQVVRTYHPGDITEKHPIPRRVGQYYSHNEILKRNEDKINSILASYCYLRMCIYCKLDYVDIVFLQELNPLTNASFSLLVLFNPTSLLSITTTFNIPSPVLFIRTYVQKLPLKPVLSIIPSARNINKRRKSYSVNEHFWNRWQEFIYNWC